MPPPKNTFALALLLALSKTAAAAAAATTATRPATGPTTAPAATFAVGLDGNTTGSVTASPAPAAVHVSALGLVARPADWLGERYAWDFGDAAHGQVVTDPRTGQPADLNTALTGPVAAYLYESPGTYTVTLTRTTAAGATLVYRATVIVPPARRTTLYVAPTGSDAATGTDPAHPLATVAAAGRKSKDHTAVLLCRGGTYPMAADLPLKHADLLVDCYGDPTQPLPVLRPTNPLHAAANNAPTFTTWPGQTADVTVRHVRVDAPWTPATTAGGYAYHNPVATFATLRGRNVTIADVELADVAEGPHGDGTLAGCLLLRVRQVDPLGIPSRTLWLQGSDVVAAGCVATNSVNESPLRAAASGVVRGLVAFNDVAQQLDPAHGRSGAKAAVTLRSLADVAVVANHVTGGEFAFDPRTGDAVDQRVAVEGNALDGAMLHVKPNVRQAVFRDNTFTVGDGPCVTVTPGTNAAAEWDEDVRVEHNAGRGWSANGRLLQVDAHPADALRGFTADPATNVYQRVAGPGK